MAAKEPKAGYPQPNKINYALSTKSFTTESFVQRYEPYGLMVKDDPVAYF